MRIAKPSPFQSLAAVVSVAASSTLAAVPAPGPQAASAPIFAPSSQDSLKFAQPSWLMDSKSPLLQEKLAALDHTIKMPSPSSYQAGPSDAPPQTQEEPPINEDMTAVPEKTAEIIRPTTPPAEPPPSLSELSAPNNVLADGRPLYSTDRLALALQRDNARLIIVETDSYRAIETALSKSESIPGAPGMQDLANNGIKAVAFSIPTLFEGVRTQVLSDPNATTDNVRKSYEDIFIKFDQPGPLNNKMEDVKDILPVSLQLQKAGIKNGLVEHTDHTVSFVQDFIPKVSEQALDKLNWWDDVHTFFGGEQATQSRFKARLNEVLTEEPPQSNQPTLKAQLGDVMDKDRTQTADHIANLAQDGRVILFTDKPYDDDMKGKLAERFGKNNISEMYLTHLDDQRYKAMYLDATTAQEPQANAQGPQADAQQPIPTSTDEARAMKKLPASSEPESMTFTAGAASARTPAQHDKGTASNMQAAPGIALPNLSGLLATETVVASRATSPAAGPSPQSRKLKSGFGF